MAQAKIEIFVIADAAQAEAVLAKLAVQTETTGLASERSGTKVGGLLERLRGIGPAGAVGAVGIEEVTGKLASGLGPASGSAAAGIEKLDASLGSMGSGMLAAGAAVGASVIAMGALVEIAKKGVEAFTAYASQVQQVKDVTGGTAEESSLLVNRLKLIGVSSDDALRSIGMLGVAIDKGTFRKYGVDVAYATNGNVDYIRSLENARSAIAAETDRTKANAEAKALLGRGYLTLARYMNLSESAYEALNEKAKEAATVNDQNLADARALKIAQQELSDQLEKLWVNIGKGVVPALTDLTNGIGQVISFVTDATDKIGGFGTVLHALAGLIPGGQLIFASDALQQFGHSSTEAAAATDKLTAAERARAAAEKEVSSTVQNIIQDDLAARQATLDLQQVNADWAKQQADNAAQAAQAVKDARASEADAETTLAQTRIDEANRVSDAEHRVADAQVAAADRVTQAKQRVADLNRKLAQDSAQDLTRGRGVEDAQKNLARVQNDIASGKLKGTDATRAYQDAEEQLARAQQDRQIADKRQADTVAQDRVEIARAKADERRAEIQGADEVRKARDELARARVEQERRVTAAVHAVTVAHNALVAAQHRTTTSAADLARHQLAVEQATLRNRAAHQKLAHELVIVNGLVHDGKTTWQQIHDLIGTLSGTDLPKLKAHLDALVDKPGLAGAGGTAAGAAGAIRWAGPSGGGDFGTTVNVYANGIIVDRSSAETVGRQVADGVWRALLAKQAGGTNLGLGGRGRG